MIDSFQIQLSAIIGDIYLTKVLKDGSMSETRRVITDEVLAIVTSWFMKHKKNMVGFKTNDGELAYLFHTTDEDKKDRIMAILKDEDPKETLSKEWIDSHVTDGHNVSTSEKVIYVEDLDQLLKSK